MMEVVVKESEIILAEKDKEVVKVVEEIKKVGFKVLREDKWEIEGEFELSQKINLV